MFKKLFLRKKKKRFGWIKKAIILCLLLILLPLSLNLNFSSVSPAPIVGQGSSLIVKNEAHAVMGEELIAKYLAEYLIKYITGNPSTSQSTTSWLGEKLLNGILRAIITAFYLILWVFYSICYGLVYLSESLLKVILDPALTQDALKGFTKVELVKSTAQTLANLCNMVYLFVLIYIAIGTMFGKTDTKQLLVKLVVAALLTNFGLVLAGVVIDFTQVIMYTIYTPDKIQAAYFKPGTEILDNIQKSLDIGKSANWQNFWKSLKDFVWNDDITNLLRNCIELTALILTAIAIAVSIAYIAIILVVRFFMLWILLILTPVAFLFSVLPQTEKYWRMWVESLTKYAFTGPILVFFLWLAKKMSEQIRDSSTINISSSTVGSTVGSTVASTDLKYVFYDFLAKNINSIFQMMALVITIWAGIYIANQFGIKGAPGVDKLIGWTKRVGFGTLGAVGGAIGGFKKAGWKGLRSSVTKLADKERRYNAAAAVLDKKGKTLEAGKLRDRAKEIGLAKEGREKLMNNFMAVAGFTSPKTIKSAVSKWWKDSNEEYFNLSEDSMKHNFNRFLDKSLGRKDADLFIAQDIAEKNLYEAKDDINNKADKLRKKKLEIADKEIELNEAIRTGAAPEVRIEIEDQLKFLIKNKDELEDELRQNIAAFAGRATEDEIEKSDIVRYLEGLAFNHPNAKFRIASIDPNINEVELNNEIDAIINLFKNKQNISDTQKLHIFDIFEGRIIEALKNGDESIMKKIFSDLGNEISLMSQDGDIDQTETSLLQNNLSSLYSKFFTRAPSGQTFLRRRVFTPKMTDEIPVSQFILNENLIGATGRKVSKDLIQQTRLVAYNTKNKSLQEPIWETNKNEEKYAEAGKRHEKEMLALEQLSDIIATGSRNIIEQTAALRKLSGSAKHYGDLIKKLSDTHGGLDGAKKFLTERFGEREAMIAFRTAEIDARKNHNLYGIGHVAYDSLTGKSQFTTPDQRNSIVRKTVSGWDSRELNQIHLQSFDNKEDVEMLAKTINWTFLSKNRAFIKGMRDSIVNLLRNNKDTLLRNIAPEEQQAFLDVMNRKDPEPRQEQNNPPGGTGPAGGAPVPGAVPPPNP